MLTVHLLPSLRDYRETATHVSTFGLAVALLYLGDRTHVFSKEQKQFDALAFGVLCLCVIFLGFITLRKSEKRAGFLNRGQTDEWKGWMQCKSLSFIVTQSYSLYSSNHPHLSLFWCFQDCRNIQPDSGACGVILVRYVGSLST